MSTAFSIGQMNQLSDALENAGFTPDDITKLRSSPKLGEFKKVLYGTAEITIVKHVIDMDADPFVPNGLQVESHAKQGQLEFDPQKVKLYVAEGQQDGKWMNGKKLQKELESQPTYNANLLDWYLAHPEFIPEEWKGKAIFFWKTIYRSSDGRLYVRYLCWRGCYWYWVFSWLDDDFDSGNPAAVAGK